MTETVGENQPHGAETIDARAAAAARASEMIAASSGFVLMTVAQGTGSIGILECNITSIVALGLALAAKERALYSMRAQIAHEAGARELALDYHAELAARLGVKKLIDLLLHNPAFRELHTDHPHGGQGQEPSPP